jgi:hypothetical protein
LEFFRLQNASERKKQTRKKWRLDNNEHYKNVQNALNHRSDVKAFRKANQQSNDGKERKKAYTTSSNGRATIAAWNKSNAGIESKKKRNAKQYRALKENPDKLLSERIRTKLSKMISKEIQTSATISKWTDFKDGDVRAHFESMLIFPMTAHNYGRVWHIGHRIARAMFKRNNPEDVKRCWSRDNLFPQLASENLKLKVKLPEDLASLQHIWPTHWRELPDSATRKRLEAKAARGLV